MDDRRILSSPLHVLRNGPRWQDAPAGFGRPTTLYNRFARWSRLDWLARILRDLAKSGPDGDTTLMDSTPLTAHRTAASPETKGPRPRAIGLTKGGLTSRRPMASCGKGRPLTVVRSSGQM